MEEENKVEQSKTQKNKGISFYKKVWYSIAKFDKYQEMANEGVIRSIKYLFKIILIMAIVIAMIGIFDTNSKLEEGLKFISEEVPDFSYSNDELKVDIDEVIRYDDNALGLGKIIVDMQAEEENQIEEYKKEIIETEQQKGFVVLKNKIIQVSKTNSNNISYNELSYGSVATSVLGKTTSEFSKADLISYFENQGKIYACVINFFIFLIGYFISYLISILVYVIILASIGNISAFITKTKLSFKFLFAISIYAFTLPNILELIYFITRYLTGVYIKYFDIAYVAIAYVYLVTVMFLIKSDIVKKEKEAVNIQKKQDDDNNENNEKNQDDN